MTAAEIWTALRETAPRLAGLWVFAAVLAQPVRMLITLHGRRRTQQLARIGVHHNAAGRGILQSHFDDVVSGSGNIERTYADDFRLFQVRESLFAGPGGFLKFEWTGQVTDDGHSAWCWTGYRGQ